ncbi:MAG: type II toxin-antitoxin system mRNA interferase toxin, RelE/StbE family [archaeon]|nr:type II toxin-antitoxin system mRNA interferase toxin, RelE/StbE family [archaeon]
MFELRFSSKSKKFVKKCDEKIRNRLKAAFEEISQNPFPAQNYDLQKVAGEESTYRIRISSYRIVYEVHSKENIIKIIKVERRKNRTYNF